MVNLKLVLSLIALIGSFVRATVQDAKRLHNYLMRDYNKYIRPVENDTDTLYVEIKFHLGAIQEFDEVRETLTMVGLFGLSWTDVNMKWDPANFSDIRTLFVSYNDVWVPEIVILNPAERVNSLGQDWQVIRYFWNGRAIWRPGNLMTVSCMSNCFYFPFDVQVCKMRVTVAEYTRREVRLYSIRQKVGTDIFTENGIWSLLETNVEINPSPVTVEVSFSFRLQRKPGHVVVTVLLPILLLSLLNVLVFVLPADSGERISYSVTVLLSIAVHDHCQRNFTKDVRAPATDMLLADDLYCCKFGNNCHHDT